MTFLKDFKTHLTDTLTLGNFLVKLNRLNESGDEQIVLLNRVNGSPETDLEGVVIRERRLQILVRSAPKGDAVGNAMCDSIFTAMEEIYYGFSTATTEYQQVTPLQSAFSFVSDDEKHRVQWSCNWQIIY